MRSKPCIKENLTIRIRKRLTKKELIFNIISLITIIVIGLYFGIRSFYYYGKQNSKTGTNPTLASKIINSNKITDNSYCYYHYEESYTGWNNKMPTEEKVAISPLMKEDKTNGKHSFTAIIAPRQYATGDVFLSLQIQTSAVKILFNRVSIIISTLQSIRRLQ